MTHAHDRNGLSLVEVLIALVILAVGIIALANLQASSLQSTSLAEELRTVTQVVEAELEWRRQTRINVASTDCESLFPTWVECEVQVVPVGALGNDITVTVTSRNADISLSAFTTGQRYISGRVPDEVGFTGDNGAGNGGNGDDNGDDDDTGTPTTPGDDDDPAPTVPCRDQGKGKGKNAC